MMHRQASFGGKLYPSSFDLLDKGIQACFTHAEGPGALPSGRVDRRVYGILSPPGVYQDIGHINAWSYKVLGESSFPDVFVVLGHGQHHEGFSTYLFSGWETPFGVVDVDKKHGNMLLSSFPELVNRVDEPADYAVIESQLPFLQFVNKDYLQDLKIIPLLITSKDYIACKRLGEILGELGEQCNLCVIGSCSLYGEVVDPALLEGLKTLDTKKVTDIVQMNAMRGDLIVFIEAMKTLFAKKGDLLYYHLGKAALSFT
jgi:AmmeMemoRadiSam system protein B